MFSSNSSQGETEVPRGESTYTIPGTYSWVCPTGVTSVSVVCVGAGGNGNPTNEYGSGGGGALAWANNITVTPGTTYSIVVGSVSVNGNSSQDSSAFGRIAGAGGAGTIYSGGAGGSPSGTVGTSRGGGSGGNGAGDNVSGGGGAGGYSGNGGGAGSQYGSGGSGSTSGAAGSGGGGGGGGYGSGQASGGGGVGLFGQGTSGAAQGATANPIAQGGSGGSSPQPAGFFPASTDFAGESGNISRIGGLYGGGGGRHSRNNASVGGTGAVRIIWPGTTRSFPSTDVGTP